MTSIAELGIAINSDDAVQAASDLDGLVAAGGRAENAIDGTGRSAAKAAGELSQLGGEASKASGSTGKIAESADQAQSRLLAMAKASLENSDYLKRMSASTSEATAEMKKAAVAGTDWARYQQEINTRAQALTVTEARLATETRKVATATGLQAESLEKLLGQINPAVAALGRLDQQQEKLSQYKAAGIIDADTYREYSSQIDNTRQKLGTFDDSLRKTGVSTAQTKAALNQLPAQFTDIFTSLAGGQNPLLVLIQQGGQIKDSFGGIGPMFDTLGQKVGAFLGLSTGVSAAGEAIGDIATGARAAGEGAEAAGEGLASMADGANTAADAAKNAQEAAAALSASTPPVASAMGLVLGGALAAAAAITALVVGYKQGSDEGSEYTKALILAGNAAGTTSGQLADIANSVASVNGTVHEASAILATLAASSRIPVEAFQMVATAAANLEDATGRSATQTVANFEKIAKEPLKATLDLNEAMNFLTASTYQQIVALEKKGDKQGAATIAMKAYADAVNDRSGEIVQKLGFWERGWKAIGDETKKTIDAVRGIGREMSEAEKIIDLQMKVAAAQSALNADPDDTANAEKLRSSKMELSFLIQQRDTRDAIAAASGVFAEQERKSITAQEALHGRYLSGLDKEGKKKLEIQQLDREREAALKGQGANAAEINRQYDVALAGINERYKEEKQQRAYTEAAGIRALDQAKQQYAVLKEQAGLIGTQKDGADKLGAAARELIQWEQQLADIKEKKTLTADQKSLLANQDKITAQLQINAGLEKENALKKIALEDEQKLLTFRQAIADQLSQDQQGLDGEIAGLGLGAKGRERLQQDLRIQQDYQKRLQQLQRDFQNDKISEGLYNQETDELKVALAERLAAQEDHYRKIDAAQANWALGASDAFHDYVDEASDVAGQTYNAFLNAFDGLEDTLVDFVTTGKLSFKDLADSIIADIARIIIKTQVVTPLLNAFFGGGGGGGSGSALGVLGSAASGGSSGGFGLGTIASIGKTVYQAFSAITGVGSSVASGWASGGVTGAIQGGIGYYANLFTGAASTVTSTLASWTAAITGNTAAIGATQAGYTGAAFAQWAAAQAGGGVAAGAGAGAAAGAAAGGAAAGAGSGFMASMAAMASNPVGWVVAAVTSAYQSGKLYDQGYRYDMKETLTDKNTLAAGGILMEPAFNIGITDKVFSKLFGGKIAAILSGSALFGSVLEGISSKIFGGKWETKDGGLSLGVTDGEFDAQQYIYQKKKGGLFGSNKKRTQYSDPDEATADALGGAFNAKILDSMGLFAQVGVQMGDSVLDGLNVAATQISTQGRTNEEIQAELDKWFVGLGDAAVQAISKATGSGIDDMTFDNMKVFVERLYSVNTTLDLLNVGLIQTSVFGGKMAEQLVAWAGGMEAFTTATSGYYSNFFSETEKADDTLAAVNKQFAQLNIKLPESRDGYRAMVEAIDIQTEAGRQMFVTLTGLAENAASAYTILEDRAAAATQAAADAAQAIIDQLMGAAGTSQSVLQRAIAAEQEATTAAYNARVTSLNDMSSTASKSVTDLTSVSNSLSAALKTLRGDSDDAVKMLRAQAQATLQSALATARSGGSLAGFTGLDDALDVVSTTNTDLYGSMEDFARDQGRTTNVVAELNALNGKQLTTAEKTVKTLQDQLDQAKAAYDAQMAQFDQQLEFAQAQMDALNGVDNSVKSVADAVREMNAAVVAALGVLSGKGTATNNGTLIDSVYKDVLGRDADAAGKNYWQGELSSGAIGYDQLAGAIKNAAAEKAIKDAYASVLGRGADADGAKYWSDQVASGALTVGQLQQAIANAAKANGSVPAFAMGGMHTGGLRLVGENGPELEVTGPSRIFNASQTASMLRGGSGNEAATVAELRGLRQEMQGNSEYMGKQLKAMADHLDDIANGGVQIHGTVDTRVVA